MDLAGKVAVVTGGGGGIGRATSVVFAEQGARVVLTDLAEEPLRETERAVRAAGGEAVVVTGDIGSSADVARVVGTAADAYGRVDVLFNNAGIFGPNVSVGDLREEDFDEVMRVNVRGVFLGLKHVLPLMIEQRSGSIVNMSSTNGWLGHAGGTAYTASKHAVIGLTKAAAAEAGPHNVRVNAVCPASVRTNQFFELARLVTPDDPERFITAFTRNQIPLQRGSEAVEVARVVCFLASDAASFVNGAAWLVDGGLAGTYADISVD